MVSSIWYEDGTVLASASGGDIEITIGGGGFSEAEQQAIVDDMLAGRRKPLEVPAGDGSKITVTFTGLENPGAHWVTDGIIPAGEAGKEQGDGQDH